MESINLEEYKALLERDQKRKEYQKRYSQTRGRDYYNEKKREYYARKKAEKTEETRTD